MISVDFQTSLLHRLDEVRALCPDMRLGQLMATIGMLGEDSTGRSLWDIEDEELSAAIERFAADWRGERLANSKHGFPRAAGLSMTNP